MSDRQAMEIIARKTKEEPFKVFKRALQNAKPLMEVKSRRVGGSNYQVPVEVRMERQQSLAIRWLIGYSRGRGGGPEAPVASARIARVFRSESSLETIGLEAATGGAGKDGGGVETGATGPSFSASATIWPRSWSICRSSSRALNS